MGGSMTPVCPTWRVKLTRSYKDPRFKDMNLYCRYILYLFWCVHLHSSSDAVWVRMKFYNLYGSTLHQRPEKWIYISYSNTMLQPKVWPSVYMLYSNRHGPPVYCRQMAMEEKLASLRKQEVGALRPMFSWSLWLFGGHLWPGIDVQEWKAVKGHEQKNTSWMLESTHLLGLSFWPEWIFRKPQGTWILAWCHCLFFRGWEYI